MTPAERLEAWFKHIGDLFYAPLRAWMGSWLEWGLELILDKLGQKAAPLITPTIERLERETDIPPEIQPILDEIKNPTGEIAALLAQSAGSSIVGGALGKVMDYLLRAIVMGLSYAPDFVVLDPAQQLSLWLRGEITDGELEAALRKHGLNSENIRHLQALISPRLTPELAIRAQFRQIMSSEKTIRDLKEQGWRDEDINTLFELTYVLPTPQEATSWMAHEAFEEDMVSKYGLDDEFGGINLELFERIGITAEQARYRWRDHWQHASWVQMVEMLHRGLVTEADVYDWFRVVEIVPHWREPLIQTAYTWPTRVDVRRWWDMRTIDESRLRELYSGMGYRGTNLDDYVLWTKVYTEFPTLMARWRNGWITEDEVRQRLVAIGMPADRVEEMIQEKVKPEESARIEEGKALTKSEVYKGVKKGFITRDQGIELLMDLNYSESEAVYLLDINVGALEGSPETYEEFKALTTEFKRATGKVVPEMPEELKAAAKELEQYTKDLELLRDDLTKYRGEIIDVEPYPEEISKQLLTKEAAIADAERQVAYAKTNYETEMAKWRHSQQTAS